MTERAQNRNLVFPPRTRGVGLLAAAVCIGSCTGVSPDGPAAPTPAVAPESILVVAPQGVRGANAPPRLVLKTSPPLDSSVTPPTLSGAAPFTVRLNLCQSDDADAGDSLNWQFHFGDSGSSPYGLDGVFRPDFDHFCRAEHTYREGTWTATLSVTDKHLEDQDRGVAVLARTTTQIRIVAFAAPPGAPAPGSSGPSSQTFDYTGSQQTFVVPSGVTQLTVVASGAEGGAGYQGGAGGLGGSVTATIAVTPGETLAVFVGGKGADGTNTPATTALGGFNGGGNGGGSALLGGGDGGGGGGASDVRRGPLYALADRLVVGGGGGGGGSTGNATAGGTGGAGGGTTGGSGGDVLPATGGGGGTQSVGGAAGASASGSNLAGAQGSGGRGASSDYGAAGGGGGGFYGGGGGGVNVFTNGAGGGGGSSFPASGTHQVGAQAGHGRVVISW